MTPGLAVLWAVGALGVAFALLFLIARRIDNYGIVDIGWSYAFGAVALFYAGVSEGWAPRRGLVAVMVVAWSARLGTHLYRRVMRHHPVEDGRYVALRRSWAGRFLGTMFAFFQAQAVSVVVLAVPFLLAMQNKSARLGALEIAGLMVWLIGLAGEAIADRQLNDFQRRGAGPAAVCACGLWRYSRHPNYFFEWLVWVGYFVFAAASPRGWLTVYAPLVMLYLLFRVTGIPLTEEQALRSKGEAYRHYQRTTSVFVPWFPRADPGAS